MLVAVHAEIARILDRSPTAVHQIAHRAREHVRARRPRFEADRWTARTAAEHFVNAALDGSLTDLMDVLAPDVTLWNDGGGRVRAAPRPIHGVDTVARLFATIGPRYAGLEVRWAEPSGTPIAMLLADGVPCVILAVEIDPTGRPVRGIYGVVNTDKLTPMRLSQPRRDDEVERLPDRLVGGVTRTSPRPVVPLADPAFGVDH
ncbi:MAG: hypothetical protein ACRDST_07415 [Pseudonocardiaceae bacterium]